MADHNIDPLHSEDLTSDVGASATSSSQVSERALEKCIDHIFSKYICPLCKRFLENPAQVPCDHSYCMSCIEWLLRNIPDPECLICGKKIVTDDAIFNFGSIKPDEVKRKAMNSLKMQGFYEEFFSAEPPNPSEEDPLLMSQNRQEHPFPKHFVPYPLAVWFQHPDGNADIRHGLSRQLKVVIIRNVQVIQEHKSYGKVALLNTMVMGLTLYPL
ncbi:TNF receptor-associated factor 6-like [Alligator sinensis]|uniref:TNF receptor-associated factor 6-like n=1 Tax=Alligator sinensis TaxID=38654 RepID=A0A3Q0FPZ7_ALLSI|nr:TNF receptor-associated factor 6-like [Alligator sinensis]